MSGCSRSLSCIYIDGKEVLTTWKCGQWIGGHFQEYRLAFGGNSCRGGCLSSFHAAQASFTTIPFKYLEVYFLTRAPELSQSVVRNLTGYLAISSFWYSFVPFRFQIRWNLKLWYRYWNFHWLEPKLLTVVGTKILQCLSSFVIFSFGPTLVYFQWKYLKGIGCERDLLHGMSSNYPQTAGKRNLFMHICEGKFWLLNLMLGFGVELCFETLG